MSAGAPPHDARATRGLSGLIYGGVVGALGVGVLGGLVLWGVWTYRCHAASGSGICHDPARVALWASAHAVLMAMHGAAIGALVGVLAGVLGEGRDVRARDAILAGAAASLLLGALASWSWLGQRGMPVMFAIALPLHVATGGAIAVRWGRAVRPAA
jgi:hypothetical protein